MNKNTPIARGVRTFVTTLAASAVAWVGIDWTTNWRPGATLVALNVIAALIAGLASFFLALGGVVATSPIGKAVATFFQVLGAGFVTFGVTSLTTVDLQAAGKVVATLITGAIAAAVLSFLTNAAEDKAVT